MVSITITITNIFTITQKLDGHVARQCVNAMRRPDALGLVRRGIEIGRRMHPREGTLLTLTARRRLDVTGDAAPRGGSYRALGS